MQKHLDKLDHSVRNVGMLLGSWAGLLYMCMDDCRAIKSLISSLHVPMPEMRNALLDLFFSVLRIKAPSWTSAFLDGRRLTVYNRTHEASAQQLQDNTDEEEVPQRLNIVDNYVAFLLAVFIEAGLLEVGYYLFVLTPRHSLHLFRTTLLILAANQRCSWVRSSSWPTTLCLCSMPLRYR